jgi:dUTP pyrophosphatase
MNNEELSIYIKYHGDVKPIELNPNGDWIDLRAAEDVEMDVGDFKLISLGVSMKLPEGYEAHIVPRSSTFRHWGIIQANHMGVVDNSYCGNNDIWMFPAIAIRKTHIYKNERICQFRIMKKQPSLKFNEVGRLTDVDRGGFGSSGKD